MKNIFSHTMLDSTARIKKNGCHPTAVFLCDDSFFNDCVQKKNNHGKGAE